MRRRRAGSVVERLGDAMALTPLFVCIAAGFSPEGGRRGGRRKQETSRYEKEINE